jgi:hypothetical protein
MGEQLVLDTSFVSQILFPDDLRPAWQNSLISVANKFRLGQLLLKIGRTIRDRGGSSEVNDADREDLNEWEPGLDYQVFVPPSTAVWEDAWWVTEALITEIWREVNSHSAGLLVVSLTSGIQVHPEPAVRSEFAESLSVRELNYPERRLAKYAAREGPPFLALLYPFLDHVERTGEYLHGFENAELGSGHWNQRGHQLGGELIADRICADLTK